MGQQYDVAIIGAGPAGATLARLLGKQKKVLLLDGQPLRKDKPCGGLLAPDAQRALAGFGLTLPKTVLCDPQIFSVRTIDLALPVERHYQRMYLNLNRAAFDRWLVSLVPEEVTVLPGLCRSIKKQPDGSFRLRGSQADGTEFSVTASWVVGADGANSMVRHTFFPKARLRSYLAIQQWFAAGKDDPFYSCVFDRSITDCCSWSVQKDRMLVYGGAFRHGTPRADFERQKEKLKKRGYPLDDPVHTEACLVLRPRLTDRFCCGKDGVFLIGEAAGFISPSSLEGMSFAFRSAAALADSISDSTTQTHRQYRRNTLSLRFRLRLKNLKCPAMYLPLLRSLVLRSGVSAIPMK